MGTDTELIPITLVMRGLVIAVPKLLNQVSPVYLNVIQLLALSGNKHVYLVSSETDHFIHRKNNLVHIKLLYNFVG